MGKSIHFNGQPLYYQVIKLLDKSTILQLSREYGGEHYVKTFRHMDSSCRYALCGHHAF